MIGLSLSITAPKVGGSAEAVNLGFDPADTGAGIGLSNDNKTATATTTVVTTNTQSVTSHTSSDLRYFEMVVDVMGIAQYHPGIAEDASAGYPSIGNSVAYNPNGTVVQNSSTIKTIATYTAGAILQFWLKPSTGEYWVGVDDVIDGSPNKQTTPTGTLTPATFKVSFCPRRINNAGTLRTTSAEFTYDPQGALGWDE